MSDKSPIQWTNATWNCIRGCSRVSEGCRHCYAEGVAARFSGTIVRDGKTVRLPYYGLARRAANGEPRWTGEVRMVPEHLVDPLRWRTPRRIFVNSMSDLFHEKLTNEQIASVFGVMAAAPHHTFQVLTKRATRMREWFDWATEADQVGYGVNACISELFGVPEANEYLTRHDSDEGDDPGNWDHLIEDPPDWPLANVHLGVSAEDQEHWDERLSELKKCPAAVRWVSVEPQLSAIEPGKKDLGQGSDCPECGWMIPVDEDGCCASCGSDAMWYGIDWVVQGGESGNGARPFDIAWARTMRARCAEAKIPYFLKQLGAVVHHDGIVKPGQEWLRDSGNRDIGGKFRKHLCDAKHGGDPAEWPADLRDSREYPKAVAA